MYEVMVMETGRIFKFLCCPPGHFFFFSCFVLFEDLNFCYSALRTESQRQFVGSRRSNECRVTRVSRALQSSLIGGPGWVASTHEIAALCQVSYLPCRCPHSPCGLEEPLAAQVAFSAPTACLKNTLGSGFNAVRCLLWSCCRQQSWRTHLL